MSTKMLDKGYEPHSVEQKWYEYWEKEGLFAAVEADDRPAFSIVIPPPNVTGVLHMGHALNNTLQDILCRYRRLKGDNVLWMPGTDHAGIATQNVVERQLTAQGQDRHKLGREKFIEAVWQWRTESGSAIINQLKRLGASCDWPRERFTMDEGLSRAVRTVFVRLYEEGLIYRGLYITNWCPRCRTALSDLEVEHEELDGHLYHIRYPFSQGKGGLVVATTRPETMLGDTAVATHPEDPRYRQLPAESVRLPLMDRDIPIIRDDYVDRAFGTGALKVTPAHDPNDFEIGRRHNLPSIKVIDDDGRMGADAGRFQGMDRFACRDAVVAALREQGLLVRMDPHKHGVGHCYRCKSVVEPNLSQQWFVKVKPLAEPAIAAVQSGRTRIVPESWAKTYYDWMFNIKDWCISRQIWWGHQIPAWTCQSCSELIVAMQAPAQCTQCGGSDLVQETDVLDTWFSSALWPFSTMGWPDRTPLLKTFYPTAVLVTGFDILFFWVARMMMMGIHFMGEVPFKDVYVHALVRDEEGKKMSKSKGNVIDPLNVIEVYGTDAFRYTLAAFAAQGRDIKLSEKRVEGYRHFINKLWNAARFALMHLDNGYDRIDTAHLTLPDRWILARLAHTIRQVTAALDEYRFNEAAGAAYQFVWHEFCDWYVEAAKPALYDENHPQEREAARQVLWTVLRDILVLLHPFAPFVTEEIWEKLPGTQGSIMRATFPEPQNTLDAPAFAEAESEMTLVMEIVTAIRTIRGEMNISPAAKLSVTIQAPDAAVRAAIDAHQAIIVNLARLDGLKTDEHGERSPTAATAIVAGMSLQVELKGVIDFAQEVQRLEKELGKLNKDLNAINNKLHNDSFLAKAPPEVVAEVRGKQAVLSEKQGKLNVTVERIRAFVGH
ncbi:MAG: valyl-tRNA synthetase [Desulfatitalea sp. BRH_c12]|nr:MAG: valyl-tRNA synthetase [Desulfatitalea sp. BRH_c12]